MTIGRLPDPAAPSPHHWRRSKRPRSGTSSRRSRDTVSYLRTRPRPYDARRRLGLDLALVATSSKNLTTQSFVATPPGGVRRSGRRHKQKNKHKPQQQPHNRQPKNNKTESAG